jgi:hypothetical protein
MTMCIICEGEGADAEMYDRLAIDNHPEIDDEEATRRKLAGNVHAECGLALGWEVA